MADTILQMADGTWYNVTTHTKGSTRESVVRKEEEVEKKEPATKKAEPTKRVATKPKGTEFPKIFVYRPAYPNGNIVQQEIIEPDFKYYNQKGWQKEGYKWTSENVITEIETQRLQMYQGMDRKDAEARVASTPQETYIGRYTGEEPSAAETDPYAGIREGMRQVVRGEETKRGVTERMKEGVQEEISRQAFLRGGAKGALVKFTEDPDQEGPQNVTTVFLVDPTGKVLRPYLSEEAFNNSYQVSLREATEQGLIKSIPLSAIDRGGEFSGYTLLTDDEGIRDDGTYPEGEKTFDTTKLKGRYGQTRDQEREKEAFSRMDGYLTWLKGTAGNYISSELVDEVSNDHEIMALYLNALAYGGYDVNDIFRDLRRKQLVKDGRAEFGNIKVIDESTVASQFYTTPEGSAVRTNPDLTPPPTLGNIDMGIFDNPIFNISGEAYDILVPPLDWTSPEGQAAIDEMKSAYHDVMIKKLEADTEVAQAYADNIYRILQEDINEKYGIKLSDNAVTAWNQIMNLGAVASERGLAGTGIAAEVRDRYLREVRKVNERLRKSKASEEEEAQLNYLFESGSSEDIQEFLSGLSEEERKEYGDIFKPSAEISAWLDLNNLKSLYPELSEEQLINYRNSVIDPKTGNYYSELYQTMRSNILTKQWEKRAVQEEKAFLKRGLEAERAWKPFEYDPFAAPPVTGDEGEVDEGKIPPADETKIPPADEEKKVPPVEVPPAGARPEIQTPGINYVTLYRRGANGQIETTRVSEREVPNYTSAGWSTSQPATDEIKREEPSVDPMATFKEYMKDKPDILGKGWESYKAITPQQYNWPGLTEEQAKKRRQERWKNVQPYQGTLYGYSEYY